MPRRATTTTTARKETAVTDTEKAEKKSMSDKPLEELPVRFKQTDGGREFLAQTREAVIRLDASEDWKRA